MIDKPNIILIVLDTVRAEQLGLYGRETDPMSSLSSFAQEASVFERAYTNAPWTLPAHASLFTGMLPSEHGCHGGSLQLSADSLTLAERLASEGYDTYSVSNNVWISDYFGLDAGFDTFYKQWQLFRQSKEIGHLLKQRPDSLVDLAKKLTNGNPAVNLLNGLYGKYLYRRNDFGAKRTTDDVSTLLQNSDEPFFLFANYMEGHAPFYERSNSKRYLPHDVTDVSRYTELSGRTLDYHTDKIEITDRELEVIEGLYDGELHYLDSQLNRLFKMLQRNSFLSDSIVVVVGDHGENIGDHGLMSHRFSVHDTLLHVPLVVYHPDCSGGNRVDSPVDLIDLHNWLLTAATDAVKPESLASEGPIVAEYLSTAYTPEAKSSTFAFEGSEYDRRQKAVITDEYKLVITDADESYLYESDGASDFEKDGRKISDETLESELSAYVGGFEHHEDSSEIQEANPTSVEQHLKDLGYME